MATRIIDAPMPNLFTLIAPIALALSNGGDRVVENTGEAPICSGQVWSQSRTGDRGISPLPLSSAAPGWSPLLEAPRPAGANQVRIEGRVILRISPAPAPMRQSLMAEATPASRPRLVERPFAKCVEAKRIGGVAERGDRLMLFLRDRRTLSAQLEKGCSPREFYQGFYMEPSDDGMLCVDRDRLMSRSGAKCQVSRLREMVIQTDD